MQLDQVKLDAPQRRERIRSGVPLPVKTGSGIVKRFLLNPWTVAVFFLTAIAAVMIFLIFRVDSNSIMSQISQQSQGKIELSSAQIAEAIRKSFFLALPTFGSYLLLFWLLDKWRPMPWYFKYLSMIWGAGVAVFLSFIINSWAARLISQMASLADPLSDGRSSAFSAPFVEEATKAIVVLLIAIVARYRLVSVLQTVCLCGLSAIGFAFVENIVYYYRYYLLLTVNQSMPDVGAEMHQIVLTRGLYTSFGHPLFTACFGIGLFYGIHTRAKTVRVLAPLTGFGFAALGHMLFNGFLTVLGSDEQSITMTLLYKIAIGLVICLAVYLLFSLLKQGQILTYRIVDLAQMGWLNARDALVFNNLYKRRKLFWAALFRGRKTFKATTTLISAITELAYLQDSIARGLIGAGGVSRQVELIKIIQKVRENALDEPHGLYVIPRPILGKTRKKIAAWFAELRTKRLTNR